MAETVGYMNLSRAMMPPGTVPPFIMRFDMGSVQTGSGRMESDSLFTVARLDPVGVVIHVSEADAALVNEKAKLNSLCRP